MEQLRANDDHVLDMKPNIAEQGLKCEKDSLIEDFAGKYISFMIPLYVVKCFKK